MAFSLALRCATRSEAEAAFVAGVQVVMDLGWSASNDEE
jgi:hypothetical protein